MGRNAYPIANILRLRATGGHQWRINPGGGKSFRRITSSRFRTPPALAICSKPSATGGGLAAWSAVLTNRVAGSPSRSARALPSEVRRSPVAKESTGAAGAACCGSGRRGLACRPPQAGLAFADQPCIYPQRGEALVSCHQGEVVREGSRRNP
jgi:hypothetical protein